MTGAISGAGTAYPSWAPEFTTDFKWGSCCSVFYAVFCRSLFVFLSFWPFCCFLRFTDSDYPFVIFKLSLYYCNNLGHGHVRKHWKPRLQISLRPRFLISDWFLSNQAIVILFHCFWSISSSCQLFIYTGFPVFNQFYS